MGMKRPLVESLVRIGICVGIAASLAAVVPALPRALLRQELEGSIRKWIVRDRQGNYVLLSPQRGSGTRVGFSLRMSQGSSPESLRDFGPAYPLEPPSQDRGPVISAGISLDHQDRIHLVWSTVTGLTGYAVVDFPGADGTDLLWQNPQTKSPGALVLADEYSRIGDIATAADGSVWFTWTESISDRQASIHLGRVHDGGLSSWRIARADGLFPASLFLDEQERFHLGWHDIYEESYYASGRLDQLDDPKAAKVLPPAEPRLPTGPDPDARTDTGRIRGHLFPPDDRSSRRGAAAGRAPDPVPATLCLAHLSLAPIRPGPVWRRLVVFRGQRPPTCLSHPVAGPGLGSRPQYRQAGPELAPHGRQPSLHRTSRGGDGHGRGGAGNQDSGDPWGSTGPSFRSRPLAGGVSREEGSLPGPGGGAGVGESPPAGESGSETRRESRHPGRRGRTIRMSTEPGTSCEY